MVEELPELIVVDATAWRAWLDDHHRDPAGVRLVLAKKGTFEPTSLTYAQALEEALCYGWIDGEIGRRDATTFRRRFTPRRPRSNWSKRNVDLVDRLEEEGRIHPVGALEVAAARADGRWEAAYAGAAAITVPEELARALAADPAARATFDNLSGANRYAVLYRVATAKRPATRARKVEELVAMLARGETIHPQRDRG